LLFIHYYLLPLLARARQKLKSLTQWNRLLGYERVQKLLPTPHMKQRLVYGARFTAGVSIIAAEAEALRGTDTDNDLSQVTATPTPKTRFVLVFVLVCASFAS
jgi:hypothetical protein